MPSCSRCGKQEETRGQDVDYQVVSTRDPRKLGRYHHTQSISNPDGLYNQNESHNYLVEIFTSRHNRKRNVKFEPECEI